MINCVNEYDRISRNVVELVIKIRRKNNMQIKMTMVLLFDYSIVNVTIFMTKGLENCLAIFYRYKTNVFCIQSTGKVSANYEGNSGSTTKISESGSPKNVNHSPKQGN